MLTKTIELLSPAKNLECGIAAINHGADAVYIGASQFGARASAGNSIKDIELLVNYAHQYRSKVYVALNTVLTDNELTEAEKLIHQIYNTGADALIVQDMAILKMDIPPIVLHASTQTDNRTVEKVNFLQNAGFSRVVLARELSLKQIKEIKDNTNVELEAFVHGALCVSYSGQCYMSQAMSGRSANKGQCAQYCRLPYNLQDANGNIIVKNKHLLSLKDLDLSDYIQDMIEAGVMSFKIEGRLKDIEYVKNITAYYRKKIDAVIDNISLYKRASAGKTRFFFEPNPEKSFRRGSTDYFLNDRHSEIYQPDTPKSLGEPIGKIIGIGNNYFELQNGNLINNGDGLCFVNRKGELTGFRVNRVETTKSATITKCFPADVRNIEKGAFLYRNQDQVFEKILGSKTSERKVGLIIDFTETVSGFAIKLTDETGNSSEYKINTLKQQAQKPDSVVTNIKNQLSKLGNTIFEAETVNVQISQPYFIQASLLTEWRRQAIEQFESIRSECYVRETRKPAEKNLFPEQNLSYLGNVTNKLSELFYREHGVTSIQPGFEVKAVKGVPLMFTKHCIKFEMGWCPKNGTKPQYPEPYFLKNNNQLYELKFDCKKCEMQISLAQLSNRNK